MAGLATLADDDVSWALVIFASSIAIVGAGGAPRLISRRPIMPAIAARMQRIPKTMTKPSQKACLTLKRSLKNQASASKR